MSLTFDIPFQHVEINISEPLIKGADQFFNEVEYKNTDYLLFSKELINPDLLYFLDHHSIICSGFAAWRWTFERNDLPLHTDGNYFIEKRRYCGINWSFSPDTYVKFFKTDNGTPHLKEIKGRNQTDTWYYTTLWSFDGDPEVMAEWHGSGPVIFNTQIPHIVCRKSPEVKHRRSIVLQLNDEVYETLNEKLRYLLR
jgi:hypothetical protein